MIQNIQNSTNITNVLSLCFNWYKDKINTGFYTVPQYTKTINYRLYGINSSQDIKLLIESKSKDFVEVLYYGDTIGYAAMLPLNRL